MENELTKESLKIYKFLKKFKKKKILKNNFENKNLFKFFNKFSKKYNELLRHKISIENKELNNIYLNNLDCCENYLSRDKFKSNYIKLLQLLYKEHNDLFSELLENFNDIKLKEETFIFIKNLDDYEFDYIVEWMNNKGIVLSRYLYHFILNNRLPKNLLNLIGSDIELYGEFTSLDISKDIEINIPYRNVFNINLLDINLDLVIYSNKENYKPKKKLLYRIYFLNYLFNNKNISLKIWNSEKKKEINYNRKIKVIGPKEINSGCTTFLGEINKISIWRREELGKVLIHEIVHSLELEDHSLVNLYDYFDIKDNILIRTFESYVEIMAHLINLIIINNYLFKKKTKKVKFYNKFTKKNKKNDYKTFIDLLNIEIIWSYFQCAKILNYYEYNNFEEFFNINGIKNKTDKYNQKSNVFSYVILKSIIYHNLGDFMNLIYKYNENILIEKIPNNIKIEFVLNSIKKNNYSFIKIINYFIKYIKKQTISPYIFKTMRLSAIEQKII